MDYYDSKELERLKKSKLKAERNDKLEEIATCCNGIGALYSKYEMWEDSRKEHEAELNIYEALGDTIGSAVACRLVGECFCALQQYDKAFRLQKRHLSLAQSADSVIEEQRALATIGRTYLIMSDDSKTKKDRMDALKNSENAFVKSLEICKKLMGSVKEHELMEMRSRLLLNLGIVCDSKGDNRASEFMLKATALARKLQTQDDLYRCQFSMAGMYQRNENYSQALRLMEEACGLARKMRNKLFECDALIQKALILLHVEDYGSVRHLLKKVKKLGPPTPETVTRMKNCYKSALKMEEAAEGLKKTKKEDQSRQISLYETLGDSAADVYNYKQAIKYYTKMLVEVRAAGKTGSDLIPVYVSLAQTYKDDKNYDKAIEFYQEEMRCLQAEDAEQICHSLLNVAEAQALAGKDYICVAKIYQAAYEQASLAKNRKLQVLCLKTLMELQKIFQQVKHLNQTQEKLKYLCSKFDLKVDDDLWDQDSQNQDQEDEDGEEDFSMSDLSESDPEETDTAAGTTRSTSKRFSTKRNEKGETALHRASIEGNLKKVQRLIEQGHPPNPRDHCGWIPLHEAANHDYYDVTKYLLEHGATVNDRGGHLCGGVTPLIDAANCGNIKIMELLVEKGANVLAKNDENQTALDCLLQWRNRCEEGDLSTEDVTRCQNMEELLRDKMPHWSGPARQHNSSVSSASKATSVRSSNSDRNSKSSASSKKPRQGSSQRRSRNDVITYSDSEDSDSTSTRQIFSRSSTTQAVTGADSDQEDSEHIYFQPDLEDTSITSRTATDTYRNAMSSLGSAANRVTQPGPKTSTQKSSNIPALLNEEDFVDDWLIDDIQQPTKKRKMDINGLFSTRAVRNQSKNVHTCDSEGDTDSEPRRKTSLTQSQGRNRILNFDSDSESGLTYNEIHDPSEPLDVIGDKNEDTIENSPQHQFFFVAGTDSENELPVISHTIKQRNTEKFSSNSRRSKQLKITSFGQRVSDKDRNRLEPSSSRDKSVCSVITPSKQGTGAGHHRNHPADDSARVLSDVTSISSSAVTRNVPNSGIIGLKVVIKDKMLFIPVPTSVGRTVSWLAAESSQRYYQQWGLKPILTLSTKDGAFFSPNDPLDLVLQGIDKIEATVESWELPPLKNRYQEACKFYNTVCYRNIGGLLETCDRSGVLEVKDMSLRPAHFKPLIRAIQCKTSIRELHLQGNRLGDLGVENLCKTLTTLPNLSYLNLSSNDITSVGLASLCKTTTDTVEHTHLQHLTVLDLSYNSLCDRIAGQITTLLTSLSQLTTLKLSSCSLTVKLFNQSQSKLRDVLHNSNIQNFDLSLNKLGCIGVELLLKSLDVTKITSLDLTACISEPAPPLAMHINNYLSQEHCGLKELTLNDCHLSSDDIETLARVIEGNRLLRKLCLSHNPKVDNLSFSRLLQSSAKDSGLEEIEGQDCGVTSPLSVDFLDALSEKLTCPVSLRKFYLSCLRLEKVDIDCLKQIWCEQWLENGSVVILGNSVEMTLKTK